MKYFLNVMASAFFMLIATTVSAQQHVPPVVHPPLGTTAKADGDLLTLTLEGKRQNFGGTADTRDDAINSPKSANIHPSGKKFYVNSLEGGTTVVFEMGTNRRLKVIKHVFGPEHSALWSEPSEFYPFTHYTKSNNFMGKPVESTFSHAGRYLWVPYYRRSYDINAQDPSAVAIIDTENDSIIRLMETGPLPKMIATSHDGKYVAISHWGNNTVGLIDVSSNNPSDWKHAACLVVDYVLPLNYSTSVSVDRDNGSGYALRGTVFTPDDKYLLVGCMGGGGGIAVIDVAHQKYLGRVMGMMSNVRHLVIRNGYLYLSINGAGYVQRIKLADFLSVAETMGDVKTATAKGWENCKVGAGARTLEISPSGNFAFVACNTVSQLCVVDTRTMKKIAQIAVDSYPVGLDISEDGKYVIVTSQGRSDCGGNAVNIYRVEYAEPEEWSADEIDASMAASLNKADGENATDSLANQTAEETETSGLLAEYGTATTLVCGGLLLAAAVTFGVKYYRKS